jgi:hypothetical protein
MVSVVPSVVDPAALVDVQVRVAGSIHAVRGEQGKLPDLIVALRRRG